MIARDKTTGEEIARIELQGAPQSAPMSYAVDDRQYIALGVNDAPTPKLVVFALPTSSDKSE